MSKSVARMPKRAQVSNPDQGVLDLAVECQIESDGVGMGVLKDGTPFLNQRGLARLCGVQNKYIGLISSGWDSSEPSAAVKRIKEILFEQGVDFSTAAHETFFGNVRVLAYPDEICMATLEYYAFEANLQGQSIALDSYRRLSRFGLKQYIYTRTGYSNRQEEDMWRIFKDRVSLTYDAVPEGFFGVFKELADLIVTLGMKGLHIDEKFVPDISVGQAWSKHWKERGLEMRFGARRKYAHNYPDYFPQAVSNPQLASCYPEDALGEFRRWFRHDYIGDGRFKRYLSKKVKERGLPEGYIERAMVALNKE
ncbi:hypothetical protein [Ruegeria arenilitoris]|uniref:hypothetical protein n=1 Tax=Ruegeria arenilitoris TaxID=1173585 RepID=UPI001480E54C|nr:hypothetical protein [Ruegeria arenilitoris]